MSEPEHLSTCARCGNSWPEASREDVFAGVYCQCERGHPGVDLRVGHHALLMRNNTGGAEMSTPVTEPARTVTTGGPPVAPRRRPAAAMDFPESYVVLGNRREQVRMAGNAVTPPAARDLVGVVAESLAVS